MLVGILIGTLIGVCYCFIKTIYLKESKMAEQAKVQAVKSAKAPVRNNMIHNVLLANTHLLHDKMLSILAFILGEYGDHGTISVVYTEEYPKTEDSENVLARFHADGQCMVVNLLAHLEMTVDKLREGCKLSPWAYLWNNLIRTPLHDFHHAEAYRKASLIYNVEDDTPQFENEAELYAKLMMVELAKKIDIEPPLMTEDPYFSIAMGELIEEILTSDESWAVNQKVMLEEGLVYYDSKNNIKCKTLREYFMLVDGSESDEWQKPVMSMSDMVAEVKSEQEPVQTVKAAVVDNTPLRPITGNETTVAPVTVAPVTMEASVEDNRANGDGGWEGPIDCFEPDEGVPFNPYEEEDEVIVAPTAVVQAPVVQAPTVVPPSNTVTPVTVKQPAVDIVKQLPVHNLTVEQMKACLQAVLTRLYLHVFNKCGFTPGVDHGFQNAAAIYEPVYVGDIPGVSQLFVTMDTVDAQGTKILDAPIDGHITGRLFKEGQLPGYHFYLNINGMKEKRSFLPQNPNKTKADGSLTAWAAQARQGNMIAMMLQEGKGVRVKISTPATGGVPNYEFDPFAGK